MKEQLTAQEVRELEKDDYIVAELHEDEYWMQGEGRVRHVTEYDSGAVHVVFVGGKGHESRLKVPADAREGLRLNGAARGAKNLRVDTVYRRT